MGKKRIYELAKEMNKPSKDLVDKAQSMGMDVKNHMGALSENDEKKLRDSFTKVASAQKPMTTSQGGQAPKKKKYQTQRNNPNFQNRNQTNRSTEGGNRKQNQNRKKDVERNKPIKKQSNQTVTNQEVTKPTTSQKRPVNTAVPAKPKQAEKGAATKNQEKSRKQNTGSEVKKSQSVQAKRKVTQNRPDASIHKEAKRPNTGKNKAEDKAQHTPKEQRSANHQNINRGQGNHVNKEKAQPKKNQESQSRPQQSNKRNQAEHKPNDDRKQKNGSGSQTDRKRSNNRTNFNDNKNQNRNKFNKKNRRGKQRAEKKPAVPPRKFRELPDILEYTEGMNVAEIAKKIHREPAEIIKKLFMMGTMVNQNQPLDKDTIELLATDYGMSAQEKVQVDIADIDKFFEADEIDQEKLVARAPVVTIMGHVDHGKTTLLDTLRHSRVTSGEAGGITQHIGAYQIEIDGKPITFLDTPGHAAFTSMRARGASITDITVLVVAADDGVMPQTVEAINHAKAAHVPIIVAVNKIDKPGANPEHVMQELSEYELIPESWGGDTIFVEISAKFNQNIDELLEMILLVAEVEDLKADPTQRAIGSVIEARLDKGKGPVATLLVQQGTLHVGDPIVVGNTYGRVRVMTNDLGRREKSALPATPVEITGLNDVPQAGDHFAVFEDEKTARQAGEERAKRALVEQRSVTSRVTLDNLFESLKEGELKEVNVIIKADVQGSAEALAASLKKIEVEGVRVNIVHSAVGAVNESDVTLAAASNAIIIGFNVRPTPQAKQQADSEKVDIRLHRIIYKVIEEIETAMKGMLDPEFEEKITGQMIVRETYKVSKVGTIAGCYVTEGSIQRDSGVHVIRNGIVIYEGKLASLKRFKDDVKEVKLGFECGAVIENYNDIKVDDVIEGFIMEEIKID